MHRAKERGYDNACRDFGPREILAVWGATGKTGCITTSKRGRGRAGLEALRAVRHLAAGRQGLSAQPTSSSERPVDPTVRHGDAGDVAADMLFERGAPGHEAESQAIVDHGEPAT